MSGHNLFFLIERKLSSYQFKKDMSSPDSWEGDHNAQYNLEDKAYLLQLGKPIWEANVQSVANMPGARHSDTIAPGEFFIKWDLVDRRKFKGPIHGIVGAYDLDGQLIDEESIERIPGKNGAPADWARWIFMHSIRKNDPAPEGELTRFAWSAGCVIGLPFAQDELFYVGSRAGLVSGDRVPAKLIVV